MTPEEIESIANAAADECMDELDAAPPMLIDPATGLLTEASADQIDATLPPWIRVDRAQPIADDLQIPVVFDLETAMQDPVGRQMFEGVEIDPG